MNIILYPVPIIVQHLRTHLAEEKAANPHVVMRMIIDYLYDENGDLNALGKALCKMMPYSKRDSVEDVNIVLRLTDSSIAAVNAILKNHALIGTRSYQTRPTYVAAGWTNFAIIDQPEDAVALLSLANGMRNDLKEAVVKSSLDVDEYRALFHANNLTEQDLKTMVEGIVHSRSLRPPSDATGPAISAWQFVYAAIERELKSLQQAVSGRWGVVDIEEDEDYYRFTFTSTVGEE